MNARQRRQPCRAGHQVIDIVPCSRCHGSWPTVADPWHRTTSSSRPLFGLLNTRSANPTKFNVSRCSAQFCALVYIAFNQRAFLFLNRTALARVERSSVGVPSAGHGFGDGQWRRPVFAESTQVHSAQGSSGGQPIAALDYHVIDSF